MANSSYRAQTCEHLGIGINKEFPKGTHAFRRVHETSFLENGGSLDLASKVYGNSPGVIDSNYLLSVNARSSASVIDMTQQRLFKALSKNRSHMAENIEKSTIVTEVNKVNATKITKREA